MGAAWGYRPVLTRAEPEPVDAIRAGGSDVLHGSLDFLAECKVNPPIYYFLFLSRRIYEHLVRKIRS